MWLLLITFVSGIVCLPETIFSSDYSDVLRRMHIWVPLDKSELIAHRSSILLAADGLAKHRLNNVFQAHPSRHESEEWARELRWLKHMQDLLLA